MTHGEMQKRKKHIQKSLYAGLKIQLENQSYLGYSPEFESDILKLKIFGEL